MFGELGPRLKGGFNDLLSYFTGTTTTFKPAATQDFAVLPGDAAIDGNGRAITVQGGNSLTALTTVNGGTATLIGGTGSANGVGGATTVQGGPGTTTGGNSNGGAATIQGGTGVGGSSIGGNVTVQGGIGGSLGGDANIKGGTGGTNGNVNISTSAGGVVAISTGAATGNNTAGNVTVTAGSAPGAGNPGSVSITAGSNTAGAAFGIPGSPVSLTGGNGGATNSAGGAINLTGGTGAGTGSGGDIKLTPGVGGGSGQRGNVVLNGTGSALATTATGGFVNIPTCAGTPTGTPVSIPTGTVPVVYDTTTYRLWTYVAGGWNTDQPVPLFDTGSGFIDGNFDQWNVNTTFSLPAATDTYTADMWVCNAGTGGAATVSRDTPTFGNEPSYMTRPRKYRLSFQQTTNASTSPTIGQKLEGANQYAGQSVTVQASLSAGGPATLVVGVKYTQFFGTGGSPSATVTGTTTVAWPITTTQTKFSVRLDIPSVNGKLIGSNGDDYLRIDLLLATGTTFTLYHSQLQIDPCLSTSSSDTAGNGGTPRPFRFAGVGPEAARVRRFVRLLSRINFGPGTTASTTLAAGVILFQDIMRAAPAVTPSAAGTWALANTSGGTTVCSAFTVNSPVPDAVTFNATLGSATFTGGNQATSLLANSLTLGTATLLLDARL